MTARAIAVPAVAEVEFTDQVLELARILRWRTAHFRPALTKHGWRTPVQGDGKGFPDLLLTRGNRLVVAELKVGRNKPTVEQLGWLAAFAAAGVAAFLWTPDDWETITEVLS